MQVSIVRTVLFTALCACASAAAPTPAEVVDKAQGLLRAGDPAGAAKLAADLLARNPADAAGLAISGLVHWSKALRPGAPPAPGSPAVLMLDEKELSAAVSDLEKAVTSDPALSPASEALALACVEAGKTAVLVELAKKLPDNTPESLGIALETAISKLVARRDGAAAVTLADAWLGTRPDDRLARRGSVTAYVYGGRLADALSKLAAWRAAQPDDPDWPHLLAKAQIVAGRGDLAEGTLTGRWPWASHAWLQALVSIALGRKDAKFALNDIRAWQLTIDPLYPRLGQLLIQALSTPPQAALPLLVEATHVYLEQGALVPAALTLASLGRLGPPTDEVQLLWADFHRAMCDHAAEAARLEPLVKKARAGQAIAGSTLAELQTRLDQARAAATAAKPAASPSPAPSATPAPTPSPR